MTLVCAGIATVYLILVIWCIYEIITAPLVDEDENVIEDPYGRMK